jgi:hypothetical protein
LKKINIISEAIYKGQIKQVNQGSFVNLTNIVNDIFTCFGIPCCENKADFFIRKTYLLRGRKKPGPNWRSLNKLVLDVYNCCAGTTLCQDTGSLQWWITTDVIRPAKTVETINFTNIIIKTLTCCELLDCCAPVSSPYNFDITADWSLVGTTPVTNQVTFEDWLTNDLGATSVVITSFDLTGNRLQANITVAGVIGLDLSGKDVTLVNKIGGFDSSLISINLSGSLFTTFNPSTPLPTSLTDLGLSFTSMTTAGYTASEPWANSQPAFPSNCNVYFTGNINSITGTNLETILLTKNCTIIP